MVGFIHHNPMGTSLPGAHLMQTQQQRLKKGRTFIQMKSGKIDHQATIRLGQNGERLIRGWSALRPTEHHRAFQFPEISFGIHQAELVIAFQQTLHKSRGKSRLSRT